MYQLNAAFVRRISWRQQTICFASVPFQQLYGIPALIISVSVQCWFYPWFVILGGNNVQRLPLTNTNCGIHFVRQFAGQYGRNGIGDSFQINASRPGC
jgi:hypothetical protein